MLYDSRKAGIENNDIIVIIKDLEIPKYNFVAHKGDIFTNVTTMPFSIRIKNCKNTGKMFQIKIPIEDGVVSFRNKSNYIPIYITSEYAMLIDQWTKLVMKKLERIGE